MRKLTMQCGHLDIVQMDAVGTKPGDTHYCDVCNVLGRDKTRWLIVESNWV